MGICSSLKLLYIWILLCIISYSVRWIIIIEKLIILKTITYYSILLKSIISTRAYIVWRYNRSFSLSYWLCDIVLSYDLSFSLSRWLYNIIWSSNRSFPLSYWLYTISWIVVRYLISCILKTSVYLRFVNILVIIICWSSYLLILYFIFLIWKILTCLII